MNNEELKAARKVAAVFRAFSEEDIQTALAAGRIRQILKGGDDAATQAGGKT